MNRILLITWTKFSPKGTHFVVMFCLVFVLVWSISSSLAIETFVQILNKSEPSRWVYKKKQKIIWAVFVAIRTYRNHVTNWRFNESIGTINWFHDFWSHSKVWSVGACTHRNALFIVFASTIYENPYVAPINDWEFCNGFLNCLFLS